MTGVIVQDLSKLSDIAEAEINLLLADGIPVTHSDIVAINYLAWAIESPESRRLLSRGLPVFVGGTTLWPLTIYGSEWFQRVGCAMMGETMQAWALAYAMTHGRSDDGSLDVDGARASLAVLAYRARLRCRNAELIEAIAQVINQDAQPEEPPAKDGNSMSPGDLSAFLTSTAGGPAEMWERQVSIGYVVSLMSAIIAQNKADDKPCATDPRIKATRALGWYTECMRNPKLRDQ